jgi:hypothetical protein
MKGEKVGVCKTTSEECDTPRRQVIYLVPDLIREHGTVQLTALTQACQLSVVVNKHLHLPSECTIMGRCVSSTLSRNPRLQLVSRDNTFHLDRLEKIQLCHQVDIDL